MSKGRIRIITGSVLIALQALAVLGNPNGGFLFIPEYWLQSIFYLLGYWGHGIVGFALVKTGLTAKRSYEDVSVVVHQPQKGIYAWLRYLLVGLVTGSLVLWLVMAYNILRSGLVGLNLSVTYCVLLLTLGQGFLLAYLIGYVGRKPSHLLSAVLGFAAAGYGYFNVTAFASVPLAENVCYLTTAALYGALAVYLMGSHRKPLVIRLLGGIGAGLTFVVWVLLEKAFPIDGGLNLTILVYTAVAPLTATEENGGN